eukprot:TRINITY_DN1963_c0_g1_i1.p1 TRINITY_DN1963_c0_g1~~TRINITY_DN1963_c0_g1_i1.p1  ORF type:complete len:1186 (+),score=374.26 TRINITY_DN1963_c0_g1_i1:80-3637(+)
MDEGVSSRRRRARLPPIETDSSIPSSSLEKEADEEELGEEEAARSPLVGGTPDSSSGAKEVPRKRKARRRILNPSAATDGVEMGNVVSSSSVPMEDADADADADAEIDADTLPSEKTMPMDSSSLETKERRGEKKRGGRGRGRGKTRGRGRGRGGRRPRETDASSSMKRRRLGDAADGKEETTEPSDVKNQDNEKGVDKSRVKAEMDDTPSHDHGRDMTDKREEYDEDDEDDEEDDEEEGASIREIESRETVEVDLDRLFGTDFFASSIKDWIFEVDVKMSDPLEPESLAVHPVVRVSFVDEKTGKLLSKPQGSTDLGASMRKEYVSDSKGTRSLNFILPVLTKPFDLRSEKHTQCKWNETLLFNVDYAHILQPNVVVFFEILEFGSDLPFGRKIVSSHGYHRIAWAFLRTVSRERSGRANSEIDLRLQLYRYQVLEQGEQSGVLQKMFSCSCGGGGGLVDGDGNDIGNDPMICGCHLELTRKSKRKKYPACLHIMIRGRQRPEETHVQRRPENPFEVELGAMDYEQLRRTAIRGGAGGGGAAGARYRGLLGDNVGRDEGGNGDGKPEIDPRVFRIRAPGVPCEIPDKLLFQFDGGDVGCLSIAFSRNGKILAAGTTGRFFHTIRLFNMFTGLLVCSLDAHRNLIYDLSFSNDDRELVSSSGDFTAKVWKVSEFTLDEELDEERDEDGGNRDEDEDVDVDADADRDRADDKEMTMDLGHAREEDTLPPRGGKHQPDQELNETESRYLIHAVHHPCFVYCSRIHPTCVRPRLLVTGGYDHDIRVFDVESGSILRVLHGHKSFVNSIDFDEEGSRMFTADGQGAIKIWSTRVKFRRTRTRGLDESTFVCLRTIHEPEMMGRIINSVCIHPSNKMLLVTTRDNLLRLVSLDLHGSPIVRRFSGIRCGNFAIKGAFSPDGRYAVCGSEDGTLCFWDVETGDMVLESGIGMQLGFEGAVTAAAWSPSDQCVAVCAYGYQEPIRVLFHENEETAVEDAEEMAATVATMAGFPTASSGTFMASSSAYPGGGAMGLAREGSSMSMSMSIPMQFPMGASLPPPAYPTSDHLQVTSVDSSATSSFAGRFGATQKLFEGMHSFLDLLYNRLRDGAMPSLMDLVKARQKRKIPAAGKGDAQPERGAMQGRIREIFDAVSTEEPPPGEADEDAEGDDKKAITLADLVSIARARREGKI